MKDLSRWLRAGDPAGDDQAMSEADVEMMRRRVMSASRDIRAQSFAWQRPVAVAATVVLTVAAGVLAGHWTSRPGPGSRGEPPVPQAVDPPRQLQFSTPGGTRIIWVFDSAFDLKETTP